MEMTKGQLLQINFAPVWKGTTYTDNVTPQNVDHFPAFALQALIFDKALPNMFVDAGVSRKPEASEDARALYFYLMKQQSLLVQRMQRPLVL